MCISIKGLRLLHGFVAFLLVFFVVENTRADYLEVRRSATVKDRPVRNAPIIQRPAIGTNLQLLDDGQKVNGYYRIVASIVDNGGWIYRTLVRRLRGSVPGSWLNAGLSVDGPGLSADNIMQVHYIDLDQGDAALLELPCGAVLVDAGGQNNSTSQELIDYLHGFFDRRTDFNRTIDTVFVTHTHIDHNRALRQIVEDPLITVSNYIHNGVFDGSGRLAARWMRDHANDDGRQIAMRAISQSEIIPLARTAALTGPLIDPIDCTGIDPKIRVLAGPYEENPGWSQGHFEDGNNKSLVLRIDFGESSFLFTGDQEESAIETMVDYYEGTDTLDVDVYQVGHHASLNGTTESLMRAMSPEIAVISMGPASDRSSWTAWAYGPPRRGIVELLDTWITRPRPEASWVSVANGIRSFYGYRMRDAVYATDWDGTVVISADPQGNMRVQTLEQGGSS